VPAGEVTGAWDAQCQVSGDPSGFDRTYRHGLAITPRVGRFYPQGFFHGFSNIVRAAVEPARITALDIQTMHVDLNHPFARFPFRLVFRLEHVLPGVDTRRGRCNSPLDNLVRYPGLAAPLSGGLLTDYGDDERGMSRMDERDDSAFYSRARLVQHLDTRALATVNALYKRLVPVHADVLDLMASFDSHLEGCSLHSLHLLGMNADELQANRPASTRILQDLNVQQELPFEAASLDAVICTASVEYLIQPCRLFAEVLRILRPGGIFVLTFSNRCFPTKAIHVWSELHEFERVGMVTQWLQQAGFVDLHTLSSCGWPRPEGDAHSDRIAASDPVYACWGFSPVQ
jgi:SAM-dependent methyltransferase